MKKIPEVPQVAPRRVFGYVRASTDEQKITLFEQENGIRAMYHARYAKEGYKFGKIFVDSGVSGSVPLGRRPQGHLLLKELEPGDMVVFQKIDRGWRSIQDFATSVQRFRIRQIRLAFVNTDIDTGGPAGMMVAQMLAVFAEFERAMISERMKAVHRHKRRLGKLHGTNPYGYMKKVTGGGRKKYVPDLVTRALISKFISWYEQGWTYAQIFKHVEEQDIDNPYTGKPYTYGTVRDHMLAELELRKKEIAQARQLEFEMSEKEEKKQKDDVVNKTA